MTKNNKNIKTYYKTKNYLIIIQIKKIKWH